VLAGLAREYTLEEIVIVTRAGPRATLGLTRKGHFGAGPTGDVRSCATPATRRTTFAVPSRSSRTGSWWRARERSSRHLPADLSRRAAAGTGRGPGAFRALLPEAFAASHSWRWATSRCRARRWRDPRRSSRARPETGGDPEDHGIDGTFIEETYAEAFTLRAARLVVTADEERLARTAAVAMTGFAASIIACGCEAGLAGPLPASTPDGRPGIRVLAFARDARRSRTSCCAASGSA